MTDRKLLEAAARAAGIDGRWDTLRSNFRVLLDGGIFLGDEWSPLTDDGDEARLEGVLCFNVSWGMASVTVDSVTERYSDYGGDKQKARRYAGVKAAARIGGKQ